MPSFTKLKLTPCLWFDGNAKEAAEFYTSIFPNSKITHVQNHFRLGGDDIDPNNLVLVVEFELDGHRFVGLNGGPHFKFNEAVSFQIDCANQEEVDYYYEKLSEGGDPARSDCRYMD
jgi:predicted 3-demethylubiquinone-9 3-methyltransferase (glyoxalase superfamily)